jgi:potassium-dependent mechanosensitive channel
MAHRLVSELERLDRDAAEWPRRSALAREQHAPAEVQASIDAVGAELAALRGDLVARRDRVLIAYERAARAQSRLESMRSAIAERRERLWGALRTSIASPVWQPQAAGLPWDELRADSEIARGELVDYLRRSGERIAVQFVLLSAVLYWLLRRSATSGPKAAPTPPRLSAATAACGALAVALTAAALLSPAPIPIVFLRLLWFSFPLLAAAVATRSFARPIPATAWTLAFAVFLNEFRALAEMSPAIDWLLLLLQVVPFAAALVHDWRRGALAEATPGIRRVLRDRLVHIAIVVLVAAIVASFVGYARVALMIVALAVILPGYAVAFRAVAWTLDQAVAGLLATPLAQTLRSVREQRRTIQRTLHRIIALAVFVVGAAIFALSYSALDDVFRVGAFIADTSVTVGDVTITLRAILYALAVAALTWALTRLVRFVLDHELLPRLDLRTGVPVAISTIVGYVLVVTGFVLVMAALGIDFTKVTLLAGALGVGVGFGLQGVVNNFASGLILMLERPINVGDQIDVGGIVGVVKSIGVRASTIRTFQGAEVIVPNSDLTAKQVTNWTLSDRARRYEIDVGVAYGSDPGRVLRLLETAAASVPEVQQQPAPRALFVGFGESSLDFRLYAWVESVDIGLEAQNGLRSAVLRALTEAGIDIPFPQRDVHVRAAATAEAAPAPPRAARA